MEQEGQKHQRRTRYKGTHPKHYEERYKELQSKKYPETAAKVIQKGSIPVGIHVLVMVSEILEFLQIQSDQTSLDATLGYRGHTSRMLERLESKGHIYVLDVDSIEMERIRQRLEHTGYGPEILTTRKLNSTNIDQIAGGLKPLDFVLVDLGVSSMQIDNPSRGFSFRKEGPLDLCLDPPEGEPALERLKGFTQEGLTGMLMESPDELYAEGIACMVMGEVKRGGEVTTAARLYEMVNRALVFIPEEERKEAVKKFYQRTLQALCIDMNSEFEVLYESPDKLPGVLKPGGRAAILTSHSGEDRIVKRSFKEIYKVGPCSRVAGGVIRPSAEKCRMNSHAHSTKMRRAIEAENSNSQAETVRQQQLIRGREVSQ